MRAEDNYASTSTIMHVKPKRRRTRLARDDILKRLEVIGTLGPCLTPDLPSASTLRSVAISHKRKAGDSLPATDSYKRPRLHESASTTSTALNVAGTGSDAMRRKRGPEPSSENVPGPSTQSATASTSTSSSTHASDFRPVRRPRRGGKLSSTEAKAREARYNKEGRTLKYSGETRHLSSFAKTAPKYVPLPAGYEPKPGSPYHVHSTIISRLEFLDGLISMTYGSWIAGHDSETHWMSFSPIIQYCKPMFKHEGRAPGEHEKALAGIISMIEGFILARCAAATSVKVDADVRAMKSSLAQSLKEVIEQAATSSTEHPATPRMLPSPASINAGSAASTPSGVHGDSSPPAAAVAPAKFFPKRYWQNKDAPPAAADSIMVKVGAGQVANIEDIIIRNKQITHALASAQMDLDLAVLARNFPRTFARIVYSTLKFHEESEPDLDDEDGELFWPGQCVNGEGLGWVCLLGRAMIQEYGATVSYRGFEGTIPRPDDPSRLANPTTTRS